MHAQAAYGIPSQAALNAAFWGHAMEYVSKHGAAPQVVVGGLNFELGDLQRVPPSVLAVFLTRRLVDADQELAAGVGRAPLCSY